MSAKDDSSLLSERGEGMIFAELLERVRNISRQIDIRKQIKLTADALVELGITYKVVVAVFDRKRRRIISEVRGFEFDFSHLLKELSKAAGELAELVFGGEGGVKIVRRGSSIHEKLISFIGDNADFPDTIIISPLVSRTKRVIGVVIADGGQADTLSEFFIKSVFGAFVQIVGYGIELNRIIAHLGKQEAYFKKLITSSADIIVTTDWRGRVRVWNPAAERILGYKPNEIRGRSVLRLYKSPAEARRVMRKMRERGGMLSNEEVEVVTKGGEVVPLSLSAAILYDTDGNEVGTVGVSRDLRPMKRLQEQLIEAQKKAAIQKTVVTLSHYINNQLMAQVALLSDLACEAQKISDDKLRRYFEDGLRRSLSRAFQIAQITKTLQNPQEIKEEQYIGELEMLSVPLPESIEPEAIEARKFGKLKVLVADDEPVIRDGFAEFLRHFGLEVDTAEDGEQAIRLIKENDYDLVISDIKMPKATGYDVFHAAKAKNPNVNVLLMTAFGYDPDHTVVKAAREGLEGVFFKEKPFDMSKLIALIERIFSK